MNQFTNLNREKKVQVMIISLMSFTQLNRFIFDTKVLTECMFGQVCEHDKHVNNFSGKVWKR